MLSQRYRFLHCWIVGWPDAVAVLGSSAAKVRQAPNFLERMRDAKPSSPMQRAMVGLKLDSNISKTSRLSLSDRGVQTTLMTAQASWFDISSMREMRSAGRVVKSWLERMSLVSTERTWSGWSTTRFTFCLMFAEAW